jgi:hypothetical protein
LLHTFAGAHWSTVYWTQFAYSHFLNELSTASRCVKDLRATEERLNDSMPSRARNNESNLFLVRAGANRLVAYVAKSSHKAFEFKA